MPISNIWWEVRLVEPGLSSRGNWYPRSVLAAARRRFEGVPVYAFKPGGMYNHLPEPELPGKHQRNECRVGRVLGAWPADDGALEGYVQIEGVPEIQMDLWRRWQSGRTPLALSMDARVNGIRHREGAEDIFVVREILRVDSLDVTDAPSSAGGAFLRPLEPARAYEMQQLTLAWNLVELLERQKRRARGQ